MSNILIRGLVAWFNDGKRLTALVLTALQLAARWAAAKGYPVPEGLAESTAGFVAAAVLTAMSKADVKLPVPLPKP
jgi:hypothetical protein